MGPVWALRMPRGGSVLGDHFHSSPRPAFGCGPARHRPRRRCAARPSPGRPGAARRGTVASHGSESPGPRTRVGSSCGGPPSRRAQPLAAEFVAGQLDRGEQGGQAPLPALQRRGRPLPDVQGRQLGISPGAFAATAPCGAELGTAIGRGDPDDQAAQEAEFQPPRLWRAS